MQPVPAPRTAVIFDFGGVLTTSVLASLEAYGRTLGHPDLPLRLISRDEVGKRLFADHESGLIDQAAFEAGLAARFDAHGVPVEADGLVERLLAGITPDPDTIALVADLRAAGHRVGLLSNSIGDDGYRGWDLPAMFDSVTISSKIGVRKPSRRAYLIACEHLGVDPTEAVMVDDLPQNIVAAARIGLAGVVHRDADTTRAELTALLGA